MSRSLYRTVPSGCCTTTTEVAAVAEAGPVDWNDITNKPAIIKSLKFIINADGSGTPSVEFDGYKPAGNTLTDARLLNAHLIMVTSNSFVAQDFLDDGVQITLNGTTIDFTNIGGLTVGSWVTIFYS